MRTVAIIQARTGSTRLPRKVLCDIGGTTMLGRVVNRAGRASLLDQIVVATTTGADDQAIVDECARLQVPVFRGSEDDVLDRYYRAAINSNAEAVVRMTADCPVIDPEVIDDVIRKFIDESADYASNALVRTYPRGLDVEIMKLGVLEHAWQEASAAYQRIHVTPFIYDRPDLFRLVTLRAEADYSGFRWTVDTPEDLQLIRSVYSRFQNQDSFGWRDILSLMISEPNLIDLNRSIRQKSLEEG